jgi:hypothetical protein
MGVKDFSSASQWAPLAKAAISRQSKGGKNGKRRGLLPSLARIASPLRLNA